MSWINKYAVNDMETLLVVGDGDVSDIMQETWNKDTVDREQFYRAPPKDIPQEGL